MIIEHQNDQYQDNPGASTDPELDAIEAILLRYPDVDGEEIDRAVTFMTEAPILQRGRLSSRPGMPEKMERLRQDRPRDFGPSATGYMLLGALMVTVIVIAVMLAG